ncbi:MFS transporter [Ruegeria hyattellae]|uniref:MFS transporter n=1 Tax=Ruegeria hyattellae TaxID=3233337 RepID=UPI00355C0220
MNRDTRLITPVLIVSCIIVTVSFAVRASFGVFQIPVSEEFGWMRTEFSLAIAIQNLAWGIGQPIFGAISEKLGDRRAIVLGALLYALGMVLSAASTTPLGHQLNAWLVGFGIAGTGLGTVLGVVGRASTDEHRSMSLAVVTAAGSLGQVIGAPAAEWMMSFLSWQMVFVVFAVAILSLVLTLPMMRAPERASKQEVEESLSAILRKAFRDPSYTMIFLGFFSCGYQLAFITAHFPAFVAEMCGPIEVGGILHGIGITTTSALGAVALSLVGLANIAGTLAAGWAGKHFTKKYLLAGIYTARTIIAAVFILLPITPSSVIIFSVLMGSLWLATVPLTSGLVAHLYGLRYMGTLYGFVFLSHQIGGFLGVWLGGRMYDIYGNYTAVWWVGVAVGAFSAVVHLPIRETRMPSPQAA